MGGISAQVVPSSAQNFSGQQSFGDYVQEAQQSVIGERNRQIDDAYSSTHESSEPKPTAFAGTAKSNFNTGLTPSQEVAYQMYRANLGPQGTDNTYDLRGYWLSNVYNQGDGTHLPGSHFTDYWKKPNHETFSTGSQYSTPEHMGGQWTPNGQGWTYEPSQWMEKDPQRMAELSKYMAGEEGKTTLVRRPTQVGVKLLPETHIASVDNYFKQNPQVAGMVTGAGANGMPQDMPAGYQINPYNTNMAVPANRQSVVANESIRHLMNQTGYAPSFQIPQGQQEWSKTLGAYATNTPALRQTIVARLASGDNVPNATPEEIAEANKFKIIQ
jgi:hypothetical protein